MTRLEDGTPIDHGDDAVREALHRSVERLPLAPNLVERVRDRAGTLRARRRRAALTGLAGAGLAVVVLGVTIGLPQRGDTTPVPVPPLSSPADPDQPPTTPSRSPSSPPPSPSTAVTRSASAPPSPAAGSPSSGRPDGVDGPWGPQQLDEPFSSTQLDPARWIRYTGSAASPQTLWSPDQVSVRGGTLRLGVARVSDTRPVARAGGVKVAGPGQRYGRWELRWRMTAAPGVVGQFVFLGEGPGGIGNVATLSSADGTLVLDDLVHGTSRRVDVDGRRFHTLAVELTPQRVRWLLDGTVVSDRAGAAPTRPVVAAIQALVQGSDCGARPLPADCSGPATFPQTLEVDRVGFWPYRG